MTTAEHPAFRRTDLSGLVFRLLDVREPFSLYFCVQERGLPEWTIRHPRRTPYHLLYVPDSDPIVGTVDGQSVRVDPGQVLWVQPFAIFDLTALGPSRNISLSVCRFDLSDTLILRLEESFCFGRRPEGEALLEELMPGHELGGAVDLMFRRAVLARILCRSFIEADAPGGGNGLRAPLRCQLQAYMTKNIQRRFGIRELAAEAGMNPDYLSRQFRLSFGAAPKTYVMQLRIRHASSYLLASDDDIAAVAQRFGYDSVFLFSRQFHQVMGQSPSAWRTRAGSR